MRPTGLPRAAPTAGGRAVAVALLPFCRRRLVDDARLTLVRRLAPVRSTVSTLFASSSSWTRLCSSSILPAAAANFWAAPSAASSASNIASSWLWRPVETCWLCRRTLVARLQDSQYVISCPQLLLRRNKLLIPVCYLGEESQGCTFGVPFGLERVAELCLRNRELGRQGRTPTFLAANSASRLVLSWSCMLLLSAIAPKETRLAVVSASSAARS